jgi:apolipoprotein D and lipocalin family protein
MKRALLYSGLTLLGAGLAVVLLGGCATRPPLESVAQVNLERYSGKWFEIARYPNWFQRGCTGETTAEYTPMDDGRIRVVNRCQTASGKWKEVQGTAKVIPGTNQARLKVNFGGPISGDYWVIGLDDKEYQWAVVGHPSRWFLWLLAREPQVSPETLEKMITLAEKQGYSRERLIFR